MQSTESGKDTIYDVVIVGAGPVGLTLAINLLRQGLNIRLIDKHDAPLPMHFSRAAVIHSRSLEVLEEMGCIDKILNTGVKSLGMRMHDQSKQIVETQFANDEMSKRRTSYPFAFLIIQGKTEEILRGRLQELGGKVEYGIELKDLKQTSDDVELSIHIADGDREETWKTKYLAGCDGAHSTVRHKLNLNFQGELYQENLALGDFDIEWDRSNDKTDLFLTENFVVAFFPLLSSTPENSNSKRCRLMIDDFTSPFIDYSNQASHHQNEQKPAHGQIPQEKPDIDFFRQFLEKIDPKAKISNPTWMTRFRISHRLANKYRLGRAFICGDAAHIHSPLGGLGMNTGIQDAYNLAWKLGHVIKRHSPVTLLDSYETERIRVADEVIAITDKFTKTMFTKVEFLQRVRNHLISALAPYNTKQSVALSQLGITYETSDFVKNENLFGGKAGTRVMDVRVAGGKRLYNYLHGYKHNVILFCSKSQFQKSYDLVERIALQICHRYSIKRQVLGVLIAFPGGQQIGQDLQQPVFPFQVIQDDEESDLYSSFEIGDESELYVVRPDGYVAYHAKPADADKILNYLNHLFI